MRNLPLDDEFYKMLFKLRKCTTDEIGFEWIDQKEIVDLLNSTELYLPAVRSEHANEPTKIDAIARRSLAHGPKTSGLNETYKILLYIYELRSPVIVIEFPRTHISDTISSAHLYSRLSPPRRQPPNHNQEAVDTWLLKILRDVVYTQKTDKIKAWYDLWEAVFVDRPVLSYRFESIDRFREEEIENIIENIKEDFFIIDGFKRFNLEVGNIKAILFKIIEMGYPRKKILDMAMRVGLDLDMDLGDALLMM